MIRPSDGGGDVPGGVPDWVARIVEGAAAAPDQPGLVPAPSGHGRQSAVLLLFGETDGRPDVLLTERAPDLRSHAGQPAFPGGALDEGDGGPVAAALREAAEETGLDPAGVDILGCLPELYLGPSDYVVTPVLGWWRAPSPVGVADPDEVASVHRVSVDELTDPSNRTLVRHPSGYVGPAFHVHGMLVWGFTGGLLAWVLAAGGLERPWDRVRVEDLPERALRRAGQARGSVA